MLVPKLCNITISNRDVPNFGKSKQQQRLFSPSPRPDVTGYNICIGRSHSEHMFFFCLAWVIFHIEAASAGGRGGGGWVGWPVMHSEWPKLNKQVLMQISIS